MKSLRLVLVLLIFTAFTSYSAQSASLIVMDGEFKNTLTAETISIDGAYQSLKAIGEVSLTRPYRQIYGEKLRVFREGGSRINQTEVEGSDHQRALLLQSGDTELRICAAKIEHFPLEGVAYLKGEAQILHGNKLFEAESMEYLIDKGVVNAKCEGCRVRITTPIPILETFCDRPAP